MKYSLKEFFNRLNIDVVLTLLLYNGSYDPLTFRVKRAIS